MLQPLDHVMNGHETVVLSLPVPLPEHDHVLPRQGGTRGAVAGADHPVAADQGPPTEWLVGPHQLRHLAVADLLPLVAGGEGRVMCQQGHPRVVILLRVLASNNFNQRSSNATDYIH